MKLVHKVTVAQVAKAKGDVLTFVLSDDTKDRLGDVINPDGWQLSNFKKNPIALFNHNSSFPIGQWRNVRVEDNRLVGDLELAKLGTSERIDEVIRLVQQEVLRAVSVGFNPIEVEALKDNTGLYFKEQELLETSLVSVPANPAAVQLARSLNTSPEVFELVFGKAASERESVTRGIHHGEQAEHFSNPKRKPNPMTIAQRIEAAQKRLADMKEQLRELIAKMSDDPTADETKQGDILTDGIAMQQKALDSLHAIERSLGETSAAADGRELTLVPGRDYTEVTRLQPASRDERPLPFATVAKREPPKNLAYRAIAVKLLSHIHKKNPDEIIRRYWGSDQHREIQAVYDGLVTRASSAPATTTTSGWASQLVNTVISDYMPDLMPNSVYPGLSAKGLRLTFGVNGIISIPSRVVATSMAGSFVGEGAPIPVRQGAFTSVPLTPKKLAVISTFTREIAQHSTPAIEALIRQAIQDDTATALDAVLLDNIVASTIRPAGIRWNVAGTTATAGGGFNALVGDIKALTGALITAASGAIRAPVWIMNPIQALAISLTQNAGGDFPFKAEVNQNQFQGYPLITSTTVTAGMVILVDAADFVSVTGDEPDFDVSDQATLHMEDTNPLAIGTAGTPASIAAPTRSLWQTDTIGIRMVLPMNWTLRRAGVVAWMTGVTW